jgi:hypothetical protein
MLASTGESDLLAVMQHGSAALPEDLGMLKGYMRAIAGLLAEKACENQPTLALEHAAAAEIEILLSLETLVAEKTAAVSCKSLECLRSKLDIWDVMEPACSDDLPRESIVHSVRGDIARMSYRNERRILSGGLY